MKQTNNIIFERNWMPLLECLDKQQLQNYFSQYLAMEGKE